MATRARGDDPSVATRAGGLQAQDEELTSLTTATGEPRGRARVALFQRLGGRDGVEALVEDLAERVREDAEIGHYFAEVDEVELNRHRTMFFSALLGGSEEYGGRSIRAAHAPFRLSEHDFDVFIRLITQTLAGSSASARDQRSVLRALERLRPTVVHSSVPEQVTRRALRG